MQLYSCFLMDKVVRERTTFYVLRSNAYNGHEWLVLKQDF